MNLSHALQTLLLLLNNPLHLKIVPFNQKLQVQDSAERATSKGA